MMAALDKVLTGGSVLTTELEILLEHTVEISVHTELIIVEVELSTLNMKNNGYKALEE